MRRITPGTVTVGVFAILFGLAAAYAARRYLEVPPAEAAKPAPPPKTAELVVAAINLPTYARVRDQDLKVIQVPPDKVPEGAVTSKSRAMFRVVKSTIMADQPVMEDKLYGVSEVPKLADRLPPGHRAVTIAVPAESALNGMIQPESRVDIALTFDSKDRRLDGTATMTVLRNVLVLATSEMRFPKWEDQPDNVRNITVAVAPEDANRLILAQRYGSLGVTLRGPQDAGEEVLLADASDRDLIDRATLLGLPPLPTPAQPIVVSKRVEMYRGGARGEVVFGADEILESINATAVAEGREPMTALPIGTPQSASSEAGEDCPDCEKKRAKAEAKAAAEKAASREVLERIEASEKAARHGASSRGASNPQPTPAPAPSAVDGAASTIRLPAGVIDVQVEAEIGARR